ncbi:MAG TPA: type II toxin-antitoxin system VapC family toxin [Spirochaetota bacterium]|nr:type II toxin-antitoxin system VapC family toxin [Spirochaetota bacterium]
MKFLLDSNILIYHLNGENIATEFIAENSEKCAISRITYIEVLSFELTPEEENRIKELLESFTIIDTNREIAFQCIKNRKERKIKVPDNIIVSTAQVYDLQIVTRNTSDFISLDTRLLDIFDM